MISEYRIIGYENRLLEAEEFADDRKDAGELGAGHSVTVLYELRMADGAAPATRALRYQTSTVDPDAAESGELMFLKFRYKPPGQPQSIEIRSPVPYAIIPPDEISDDFALSSALAAFGMLLRGSEHSGADTPAAVVDRAEHALGHDPNGYRQELLGLIKLFEWLSRSR